MKMRAEEWRKGLYVLDDGRVRAFLIVGGERALLIDTGFPDSGVKEAVEEVTNLPVTVLLTHGDVDHVGGLEGFSRCFLHEKDWHLIRDRKAVPEPLREGDVFRCGDYCLEVVEIPGHTYGSVAFLDRGKKLLISGDSVQKEGPIYMFGGHRNLDLYVESQKKLAAMEEQIEVILPSHHEYPIGPEYIGRNLQDAIALQEGRLTGERHPSLPCLLYEGESTGFYYVKEPGEIGKK